MKLKKNLLKLTVPIVLILSFFYILNFVTDKKDALANINNKQIVEVFKTPSCGCCYGYVLFLEEEKFPSEYFFDMEVALCDNCKMFQLVNQPEPERMFNENYAFFSGTSKLMAKHFKDFANHPLPQGRSNISLGSNGSIISRIVF